MNIESPENHHCGGPQNASPEELSRRRFFARLSVGLGSLCGLAIAIPGVGFILAPLFSQTPQLWRAVGKVNDFKIGQTVQVTIEDSSPLPWAGVTAKTAAWLRRMNETEFIAFAVNCSHLGCPVRWLPDANLFMCPCHGGVYYADGTVAAGPPPKPLTRYNVRIQDGEVQLQTRPIPIT
jgi:menaquinol-cytochrome c reductase iron-sulfur subunit